MELEHRFAFRLAAPPEKARDLLFAPERVFSALPGLEGLKREGDRFKGRLCGEAPIFGKVCFPFESRLHGRERAELEPIPLEAESFWAELGGVGEAERGELRYRVRLVLHAHLPAGEKWGGRALRRMVEAALARNLSRVLASLPERVELG